MTPCLRLVGAWLALGWLAACQPAERDVRAAPPARSLPQVRLGLCEDYPEESRSLAEVGRDLDLLQAAGLDVLRISIGWDGVEPERDRYDFAFWDAFVDQAVTQRGLTLIPYVAYTPAWTSDGEPDVTWKTPPRELDEWAEIVRLLAERYRGRIRSWELWNEPDNRDYWLGTPGEYAALLEAGSRAVRAADPDAAVVFGGLAGGVDFLREVFDHHGGAEHVDVVNLHAYYETWNPNPLETIPEYVVEVRELVQRHGRGQTLWMAEVGYSNYTAPASPRGYEHEHGLAYQAVMLQRTLALSLAIPELSLFAWYELKDPRPSDAMIGDDHNRHLGVTFADYRPKPAYDALVFANQLYSAGVRPLGAELTIERSASSELVVRGFLTARGSVLVVAWLPTRAAPPAPPLSEPRDGRSERARVVVSYPSRGEATWYDARGRVRARGAAGRVAGGHAALELEVRGGDVVLVELPVATGG